MDYQEFLSTIQERILEFFPKEYEQAQVLIHQVMKNNDTALDALIIRNAQDTVTPQIYLADLFAKYQMGMSMDEVLTTIADTYMEHHNPPIFNTAEQIQNYENMKELLRVQLINKESNGERLSHTPHWDIENTDLTAVLRIYLPSPQTDKATILVTDKLVYTWGQEPDALYQQALANTIEQNPPKIDSLINIIFSLQEESNAWQEIPNFTMEPYEQYVLSNSSNYFGASVLLYPEVLKQLSQNTNSNLFILPSSIHELILMRDNGDMDAAELQAMVASVNKTELVPEDILSDEVYYYDKNEQTLTMATNREQTAALKNQMNQVVGMEDTHDMDMEREV
ncbi:hypothetical protein LAD12857_35390 [Lacrimispora amygdalina]|uniref:Uncharacterized protein n=2 Tax=Lacrimispora TaxID=2719231 RepID=A0ABX1VW36_9FIRM|nr:DUF5688 family protein [Lacrimispora defluvii]NNJ31984.1 hypothetical protein [Lacrimispora defluvii]